MNSDTSASAPTRSVSDRDSHRRRPPSGPGRSGAAEARRSGALPSRAADRHDERADDHFRDQHRDHDRAHDHDHDDHRDDHHVEPIRRARWPIVLGVLAGLLVALGGVGYALVHPVTWTAERSVVIVPGTADRTEQAALYDSLSHGQVTATAGEIYSQHQWHPDTPGVTVTAGVIPPSSVLQVTAAGTDRAAVESALQQVLDNATPEANRILSPYRAEVLNTTPVSAHTGGLSTGTWIGIALFAGVLAAAVTIMVCHAARARVLAARASASGSSSTPDRSRVRPRRG